MLLWSGFWVSQSCGHNAFGTIVNLQTCFTSQYLLTERHTFATLTQSTVTTIQWTENLTPVGTISYHWRGGGSIWSVNEVSVCFIMNFLTTSSTWRSLFQKPFSLPLRFTVSVSISFSTFALLYLSPFWCKMTKYATEWRGGFTGLDTVLDALFFIWKKKRLHS